MGLRMRLIVIPMLLALLSGCSEVLYSKLTETQANEVLATLAQARVEARKTRVDESTWQVEVDSSKVGAALMYLRSRGVPSQPAPNLGEVFKKDGLISSPIEERARYASALQDSIAATLRRIDGIADARVHVAIPHNDPLAQRVVPASAAVFVKHLPSLDIEMLTPSIKSMVMASVEGLDYRNISLIAVRADAEAAVPATPTRSASFMGAQAAGLGEPALAPPGALHGSFGERIAAALAGFGVVAIAGWGVLQRRRSARPARRAVAEPSRRASIDADAPVSRAPEAAALVRGAASTVPDRPSPSGAAPSTVFEAAARRSPRT